MVYVVAYHSMTGNNERIINKLKLRQKTNGLCHEFSLLNNISDIDKVHGRDNVKIHLLTFTTGIGEVHEDSDIFVRENIDRIVSISSSGNQNWGRLYGIAADKLSEKYYNSNIPIFKFELSGDEVQLTNYENLLTYIEKGSNNDSR
jgi:protein involved in ribonucleotide reduction